MFEQSLTEAPSTRHMSQSMEILSEATREAGLDLTEDEHEEHEESGTLPSDGDVVNVNVKAVLVQNEVSYPMVLPIDSIDSIEDDRLTDSNSSDKMSSSHERDNGLEDEDIETDCSELDSNAVPANFPIKGRILARLCLKGKSFEYFMTKDKLIIGRNSSKGAVDIDIGHSNFISRNHITIVHEAAQFYLSCGGKNGVFIGTAFQSIGAQRMVLPKK